MIWKILLILMFPCCLLADDTTYYERTYDLDIDNWVETYLLSPTNHGTDTKLRCGVAGAISDWVCRPIATTSTDIETDINDTCDLIDILVACSMFIPIQTSSNITDADTFNAQGLDKAHVEVQSDWDVYSTGNSWTVGGGDVYGLGAGVLLLDTFALSDSTATGWIRTGGDTLTGSGFMTYFDSIVNGSWDFHGFRVKMKAETGDENYADFDSDEAGGADMIQFYIKYGLITVASGDWTSDWHTSYDWNDVNQDWNSGP